MKNRLDPVFRSKDYPWPGNVRELEQAVRRIILAGEYAPSGATGRATDWLAQAGTGGLTAQEPLAAYCGMLYRRYGTYEEVAVRTALDRRTVKKYVGMAPTPE